MKVVINACYGGFSLSRAALHELRRMGNACALADTDIGEKYPDSDEVNNFSLGANSFCRDIPRNDTQLLAVIERMGPAANGGCADLKIVEIPDDVEWVVEEYDGNEWIAEAHRTWS